MVPLSRGPPIPRGAAFGSPTPNLNASAAQVSTRRQNKATPVCRRAPRRRASFRWPGGPPHAHRPGRPTLPLRRSAPLPMAQPDAKRPRPAEAPAAEARRLRESTQWAVINGLVMAVPGATQTVVTHCPGRALKQGDTSTVCVFCVVFIFIFGKLCFFCMFPPPLCILHLRQNLLSKKI